MLLQYDAAQEDAKDCLECLKGGSVYDDFFKRYLLPNMIGGYHHQCLSRVFGPMEIQGFFSFTEPVRMDPVIETEQSFLNYCAAA